ncbi:hypothetical protein SISSUDRAFT_1132214 [Sistotremastrum suecicum HHB10207 ss-3]|uniref:F-box domain-containing protein n=1 Tax=Sistotremastrum suecicum HHB10207 ss-3 TaxID=1314776 RepID=A0A165Z5K7_9AGAM|nr:hypothetical protein SISSUDRAFT_1132214 [Sistotremastrum suecicum HHB10207 ss-3]
MAASNKQGSAVSAQTVQARTDAPLANNSNRVRGGNEQRLQIYISPTTFVSSSVAGMNTEEIRIMRDRLIQSVTMTNRILNSRSPCNRLSDELLGKILILTGPLDLEPWIQRQSPKICLYFLSICSRWRIVACRTPKLWNGIWLNWPARFIALALKRSSKCELHIGLDYEPVSDCSHLRKRFWPLIEGEVQRVTKFDIIMGLEITSRRHWLYFDLFTKVAQMTLRGPVSSSATYLLRFPHCRHLILYETVVSPFARSCSFTNLQKLEIIGIDWTVIVHKVLGNMLRNMPQLETLIVDVSPCERQSIDDSVPVVIPATVKTFQIQCHDLYPLSCLLFDILSYPSNILVKWTGSHLTESRLLTLEENDEGPVERCLKLLIPAFGCFDCLDIRQENLVMDIVLRSGNGLHYEIDLQGPFQSRPTAHVLSEFMIYLSQLVVLDVAAAKLPNSKEWMDIFRSWSQLKVLGLHSSIAELHGALYALRYPEKLLCPSLRELDLTEVVFLKEFYAVRDLLQDRDRRGARLEILKINDRGDLEGVEKFVDEVEISDKPL